MNFDSLKINGYTFPPFLQKGNTFYDFLFTSILHGISCKRKKFVASVQILFFSELPRIEKGGKNESDKVAFFLQFICTDIGNTYSATVLFSRKLRRCEVSAKIKLSPNSTILIFAFYLFIIYSSI